MNKITREVLANMTLKEIESFCTFRPGECSDCPIEQACDGLFGNRDACNTIREVLSKSLQYEKEE